MASAHGAVFNSMFWSWVTFLRHLCGIGLVATLVAALTSSAQGAATFDVCSAGCPFVTIQQAIDSTGSDATVRVVQGTYLENVVVEARAGLTIVGGFSDNSFSTHDPAAYPTVIDAQGRGSAITLRNSTGVTIDGFSITNGQGFSGGGVLIISTGPGTPAGITLRSCEVSGNLATYAAGISAEAESGGHTIATLLSSTVANNVADRSGAGIALNPRGSSTVELHSSGNVIRQNRAANFGGGIYVNPETSSMAILTSDGDSIRDNVGEGLAAFSDGGSTSIALHGSVISGAQVASGAPTHGLYAVTGNSGAIDVVAVDTVVSSNSGGVFVSAFLPVRQCDPSRTCNLSLGGSTIVGEADSGDANSLVAFGGLVAQCCTTVSILDSTIADSFGGGITISPALGDVRIERNHIRGNDTLFVGGGGLYVSNDSTLGLSVRDNSITGNGFLYGYGGGAFVDNSGTLSASFSGNVLSHNGRCNAPLCGSSVPTPNGGAGLAVRNSGTLTWEATNNVIASNETAYDGGGIYVANSQSGRLVWRSTNETIAYNRAGGRGGGLWVTSDGTGSIDLLNDILYANLAAVGADFFNSVNSATVTASYSALGSMFGLYSDVAGNVRIDPRFVDPADDDFRLTVGSPCIDAATPVGAPAIDIGGMPRPQGTGIDMGAYEGAIPLATTSTTTTTSTSTTAPTTSPVTPVGVSTTSTLPGCESDGDCGDPDTCTTDTCHSAVCAHAVVGFSGAACELAANDGFPFCAGPIAPALRRFIEGQLRQVRHLLQRTSRETRARLANRLLKTVDKKLRTAKRRAARGGQTGKLPAVCAATIGQLCDRLITTTAGLRGGAS